MPKPHFSEKDELYFSYSGLKTYVINLVHNLQQKGQEIPKADVAASFQKSATAQLVDTLKIAIERTGIRKSQSQAESVQTKNCARVSTILQSTARKCIIQN